MELRTLGYLVAVIDEGSVSAAADAVHVTQPAVSRQLRQLETELGIELFDRRHGRLVLSAAGRDFLPLARDILVRAEGARSAARSLAAGRLEQMTIAAPTTTLTDVIAPFVATLQADDPMPTVVESDSRAAHVSLQHGADLAIVTERPHGTLASAPVAILPVWAYVPDGHLWSNRAAVSIHELTAENVLALQPTSKPRQILDVAFDREGETVDHVVDCSNSQVAQALAAAGRGVAVVSDDPRFGLHPLRIVGLDGALQISLFAAWEGNHHASNTLAALAERLRQFCVERYGAAVDPN